MKRLWLICLALTLALCGCELLAPAEPTSGPTPSPTPTPDPAPVLAFFGSSTEDWDQALREAAADWCREVGWELVEYDCLGLETTQAVQVDDLERGGGADMAVLCAVSPSSLEENAAALAGRGVRVITFGDSCLEGPRRSLAHLAPDSPDTLLTIAAWFRQETEEPAGVVILHDVETAPLEALAREALEEAGVQVVEETYTWGSVDFAQIFLADALARHSNVGGVLTFSRTGAQGARRALDEAGLDGVKVLCTDCTDALRADLEEGTLDGLVVLETQGVADKLKQALTDVAAGKRPGSVPLAMEIQKK